MTHPTITIIQGSGSGSVAPASSELQRDGGTDPGGRRRVVGVFSPQDRTAVLDAAMRGTEFAVVIDPTLADQDGFLDELGRVAELVEPGPVRLDPQATALLGHLADGASTAEAARRLHVSTRSAYRLLAEARDALGVSTTAEAVLAIRSGRGPGGAPRR
jgi:hypothetical protein